MRLSNCLVDNQFEWFAWLVVFGRLDGQKLIPEKRNRMMGWKKKYTNLVMLIHRCYQWYRNLNLTWNDANYHCLSNNQRLVTVNTPQDFEDFRRFVSSVRGMRSVYIGAQLFLKLDSVAIVNMYRQVSHRMLFKWLLSYITICWKFVVYTTMVLVKCQVK